MAHLVQRPGSYCCSHGLNGQPKGCPTYSFSHVSRLEPASIPPATTMQIRSISGAVLVS